MKYVRLYGMDHKRTDAQFEITWKELQSGLPRGTDGGFLLGVSGDTLLLDGEALEAGQAERSFAQLLNTSGLASIHFTNHVTQEEFSTLVTAFATGGSRAHDVVKKLKETFGANRKASIRINEVKFIAADPTTGEISISAQLAAQTLGAEFRGWLDDPHKLLQLIAAAEGARNVGSSGTADPATENVSIAASQGVAALDEEEVVQAIRLLTKFGEASADPDSKPVELQAELDQAAPNTKVNLQELLSSLAANVGREKADSPLLMKAAEHMAIRFALDRFQKGDMKVNAVHQMLEHMSRQMDTLRKVLRVQEDKMSKAGILVESHADILDRMFWNEVSDAEKKRVLLSKEAQCVPPRNLRQFVELLVEQEDLLTAREVLDSYASCLVGDDAEGRRKSAIGISQLADLYASAGAETLSGVIHNVGAALVRELDPEMQSLLGAAFVRLSVEAGNRRQFHAVGEVCDSIDQLGKLRPSLAGELRPRVGVENRLPEYIEQAIKLPQVPPDLLAVLRKTSSASAEHLAERFFRCMRRDECDRMVFLAQNLGPDGAFRLREMLRTGPVRQGASVIGLMSRLDVPSLLELLPIKLRDWNRFYHDVAVRQIAYGAASDRGRTLLELVEYLDPLVLPQTMDEIGMSGDRSVVPPLLVMAESGDASGRPPLLQLKAIESLGRLGDGDSTPVLRKLLEEKKMWKWVHHRELRIAAAQALTRIDPRYASQVMAESGLEPAEVAIAPLDSAPACPWVRQRRYERIALRKTINATLSSSWGKAELVIRELSLGGGMGTKGGNMRLGSEAVIDISSGVRKIRAHVLLRRSKINEVGFEIVDTDLESRYRLRRILVESIESSSKARNWDGGRK